MARASVWAGAEVWLRGNGHGAGTICLKGKLLSHTIPLAVDMSIATLDIHSLVDQGGWGSTDWADWLGWLGWLAAMAGPGRGGRTNDGRTTHTEIKPSEL